MEKKYLITIILLILILAGIWGYHFSQNSKKDDFNMGSQMPFGRGMGNFSLSEEEKAKTISFFNDSKTLEEKEEYCRENLPNCAYYCIELNKTEEYCKNMQRPPLDRENFSRGLR